MSDTKKPQKKPFTVTSAFVWDKAIKKPGSTVELTAAEAQGLKARGKIEEPNAKPAKKAAATDAGKADPAKAPA